MARYEQLDSAPEPVKTNYYNKNPGWDNRLDSEDEYMLLKDICQAFEDVPPKLSLYSEIMDEHGYEPDFVALNIKGIVDKTLPFYKKYLQANTLSILLKTLAVKVVDNNFKFTLNDKEIMPTNGDYQNIVTEMNKYGKILVNVLPAENIKEFKYDIIEPYRFYKDDNKAVVFTITDDYEVESELFPSYFKEQRFFVDGLLWVTTRRYYVDREREHWYIEGSYTEEAYDIDTDNMFLLTTADEKSIIEPIRNELFMIDLTETAKALEVKGTQLHIHIEDRFIENGQVRFADIYRIYQSDGGVTKPLFEVVQPKIREQEYENIQSYYFKAIATDMGMSPSQLGFIMAIEQTATNALLDDTKSIETVNNLRDNFLHGINKILTTYFPTIIISLPQFYSQSIHLKATVINQLTQNMSFEQKIKYLHPEMTEDEQKFEIALLKYQQNAQITKAEKELLAEYGYDDFVYPYVEASRKIDKSNRFNVNVK